jgi:hypothetical protein
MMYDDTGLDTIKKAVITKIFPLKGENPALSMAAIKMENTEVVLQVEDA